MSPAESREFVLRGHGVFEGIEKCNIPVIAVVNGFALGGGCELAMSCHVRIASTQAGFGQPEGNLGLIPGYDGTQRLPQLVGKVKAMELILTGDIFEAHTAFTTASVNLVAEPEALLDTSRALGQTPGAKVPIALSRASDSVNARYASAPEGYEAEASNFGHVLATDDFGEGTSTFLEKPAPNFKGR